MTGRKGHLRINDNRFMHRRFLYVNCEHEMWWVVKWRLSRRSPTARTNFHAPYMFELEPLDIDGKTTLSRLSLTPSAGSSWARSARQYRPVAAEFSLSW